MKETWYFSHDYNAQQDDKLQKLLAKRGWEGYGLYWGLIESLYQNNGYFEFDCERIAFIMRTQSEIIQDIISNYDLFFFVENKFASHSVLRRLEERKSKTDKARKSAKARWKNDHANAMRTQCERNAIKESKVKESKNISSNEDIGGEENSPSPSPTETMKDFVLLVSEKNHEYVSFVQEISEKKKIPLEIVRRELDKFINYWCEKTRDGKRERWQTEKTFEVQRRLATWFMNMAKFGSVSINQSPTRIR